MTTRTNRIRVGIFVVIAAVLTGVVLIAFGGMRLFGRERDTYSIDITESAYGLESGARVYVDGIRVGPVTGIELSPADLQKVRVTIEVDAGTPIHTDTRAIMQHAGITGLKEIDLRGGTYAAPRLQPGATIAQGESTLDHLERQARTISERTGEILERAQKIVDNLATLTEPREYQALLQQARTTADNLAAASGTLRQMVSENRTALRRSIESVDAAVKSTSELLDGQVAQLLADASSVVGDLKGFVRENQSSLRAAVTDLRHASRSFKDLAREVRQKPSRLLYGKSAGDRKLP